MAERQTETAFPQRQDLIVIVLDGADARRSEAAAEALAAALRNRPDLFRSIRRPDAGAFWTRHGLLYLDLDEVREITEQLIAAQGLLGPLAADPSLRGIADLLRLMGEGLARGEAEAGRFTAPPFAAFAEAAEAATEGRIAPPDWVRLMTGRAPRPLELRRLILVQPALNYEELPQAAPPPRGDPRRGRKARHPDPPDRPRAHGG